MSVLFLIPTPPPKLAGTDAVFQEIEALHSAFGGERLLLTPMRNPASRFPRQLFGLHNFPRLRSAAKRAQIAHVHYPEFYRFPILAALDVPIVYSVTAGVDATKISPAIANKVRNIVVSNPRDLAALEATGVTNGVMIMPGLDLSRFRGLRAKRKSPGPKQFRLLMASAPWNEAQFDLKGVDGLIEAVAREPTLHLTLLWRGLMAQELRQRISESGAADRIEVHDGIVDVARHLKDADAAIVLAKRSDIVKAWPHSLLEALASGVPVIVSDTIAMADYVREKRCGLVVDEVSSAAILRAVVELREKSASIVKGVAKFSPEEFSIENMLNAHAEVYGFST